MYPDAWPNNHILNTLLSKLCIAVFGPEQWAVRLPNVLLSVLFLAGIYKILSLLNRINIPVVLFGSLAFLANAYLLDFFSLCRGYGMAISFGVLALAFLIQGYKEEKPRAVWIAFILALLGSYANFTLLIFWASVTIITGLFFLFHYKSRIKLMLFNGGVLVLSSLLYLALIYTPIRKMTSTDQFQYWSSSGFYEVTIKSLVFHWVDGKSLWPGNGFWASGIVIMLALGLLYVIVKMIRKRSIYLPLKQPLELSIIITLVTIGINLIQILLLETPNLTGRTALIFYPLLASCILFSLDRLIGKVDGRRGVVSISTSIVFSILLIYLFSKSLHLTHTREWWYDANTYDVLEFLEGKGDKESPVVLATQWYFHPSFLFYEETGKTPFLSLMPYDKNIDPEAAADYYYVFESEGDLLKNRFETVKNFNGKLLMRLTENGER